MAGNEPTPDEIEDSVLSRIASLTAAQLVTAFDKVDLEIEDGARDDRKKLRKLLTNYLWTTTPDNDKMTEFLTLYDHFFPKRTKTEETEPLTKGDDDTKLATKAEDKEPESKVAEAETSKVSVASSVETVTAKKDQEGQETKKMKSKEETTTVTRTIRKDFKLSGMIGGTSESALSLVSLQFEIEKARKMGHSDVEICSVVISKVADKELRDYFETEPDIELDDVLDMLKSSGSREKSSTVYTAFTTDKQKKGEKAMSFITRVLKLRKKVVKLGKEEGRPYDEAMLAERSFEIILGGLRDNNIRTGLENKIGERYEMPDRKIMKHAADVVAVETARSMRLFGKTTESEVDEVEVNEIGSDADHHESKSKQPVKKKLNPFTEIEVLRAEIRNKDEKMTAQLNEIKQLVLDGRKKPGANNTADGTDQKPPNKCPACHAANKPRCYHCWFCGARNHKLADCPENQ